jgi:hypothetical protein
MRRRARRGRTEGDEVDGAAGAAADELLQPRLPVWRARGRGAAEAYAARVQRLEIGLPELHGVRGRHVGLPLLIWPEGQDGRVRTLIDDTFGRDTHSFIASTARTSLLAIVSLIVAPNCCACVWPQSMGTNSSVSSSTGLGLQV